MAKYTKTIGTITLGIATGHMNLVYFDFIVILTNLTSQNLEQYLKNRRRRSSTVSLSQFAGRDAVKLLREETSNSLHLGKKTSLFSSEPLWEPNDASTGPVEKRSNKANLLDKRYLS